MRLAGVIAITLAVDLQPQHAPTPARKAGEYLAELSRKPTKLAGSLGLAEVRPAHVAELSTQLNARAQACGAAPLPVSALQVREVHADAWDAGARHYVVRRAGALLRVRARAAGDSVQVEDVDPPVCSEEPEEDGGQVLSRETQIVADTLAWMQSEVDARRADECPSDPRLDLKVQHTTLKVAAGFVVGMVVKATPSGPGLDPNFPESVREKAQDAVPEQAPPAGTDPVFHKVIVTWEYAPLRSVTAAMTHGDVTYNDTEGLIPFAHLPVEPCALLASSSFTVGTLENHPSVEAFYQKYSGYRGFEKGKEHVDLIPPTEPRAMSLRQKHKAERRLLRSTKKKDLHILRAEEDSCPKVCPEGYSRHFADLFFARGDSSCYDDCECSTDANYATLCNLCCKVNDDSDGCDAVDLEANCDALPRIPEAFDLREEHADCFPPTVVEDQGLCGSCFAFASIGATADRVCIQHGERLLDEKGFRHLLSVQQFLSCNEPVDDPEFASLMPKKWGCDGGYFLAAGRFLLREGLALQDHYPYTSKCVMEGSGVVNDEMHLEETHLGRKDRTCSLMEKWLPRDLLPCSCQGYSSRMRTCADTDAERTRIGGMYRLPNVQDISRHTGTFYKHKDVERMMMLDLMTEGTLYAAFKVYEDFDGFFYDNPNAVYQHRWGQLVGGHAIVIVGWGELDGVPYWLIRNSWGTNWGDGGYFRIRRGTNECGIEARVWGSSNFESERVERPRSVNPWTLYGYHEGKTFDGIDLRSEDPRDLAHLKEVCKFDAECVGFDSLGQLKRGFPTEDSAWKPLDAPIEHGDRVGTSTGGFYTKLTREKVVVQTSTAEGQGSGTLGPLEVYLCDGRENCAPVPVELAGLVPGKQTFEKDVWLPVGFSLHSVEVYNRNRADSWVPSGPIVVALPTRPGSEKVRTESFKLAGSFTPERAPWEGAAAAAASVVALLLLQ